MNIEHPLGRALFVVALGLAAISGVRVIVEFLLLPMWLQRVAIWVTLFATVVAAIVAARSGRAVTG